MTTQMLPVARRCGFTLIEVLVALLIMAVIAAMGWRGVDSMARSRDISQAAAERSLRLSAIVGQWEQDLQAVLQIDDVVPGLDFDGAALRLTRRVPEGLQLVVWSLREGVWRRWTAAPVTQVPDLQQAWLRSQQLLGNEPQQLELLDSVQGWQLYFYRDGGWSNAQSTGDLAAPSSAVSAPARQLLPTGVRLVIELPEGKLTRDVLLGTS